MLGKFSVLEVDPQNANMTVGKFGKFGRNNRYIAPDNDLMLRIFTPLGAFFTAMILDLPQKISAR